MMQVHRDLENLPEFKNATITIGTFDGVHQGHRQIIKLLIQEAASIGGETVIITFHPHPRRVVTNGKSDVKIINTLSEKIELLDQLGIDHLVVVAFNEIFADQTAEEYIQSFLVKKFNPASIIIGYDHRFGKNRFGDYHLLEKFGETYGYKVKEIPEHVLNEIIISSTKIREALLNSDVDTANNFLGYKYFFEGKVVVGNRLGRTIGYPTANLSIQNEDKLVPGNGVYAVQINISGKKTVYGGMMNIGMRPTIDGTKKTIEVNIFRFDEDIYGENIRVYLSAYLRSEVKFAGLEQLKEQLARDKTAAMEKLKG
ncbi:MAG: bifunctional riboflavin kinase/FAD synthetase [Segetibacter sp.]